MHRRPNLQPWIAAVTALTLTACLPATAAFAESGAAPDEEREPRDPPGVPARPAPGAPPAPSITFGQGASIQVNVGPSGANIAGDAANEPSIAVDPLAPNRMAIGWRQFDTTSSNFREGGYSYSTDGGRTWAEATVLENNVFRSDPVLASDKTGRFYYSSLKGDFLVDVFISTDNGATWPGEVPAFGGDKQWLAVDRTDGIGMGYVYQAWSSVAGCCGNDVFTRSTNGGITYSTPIQLPNNPRRGTVEVGPDGAVYVGGVALADVSQFYVLRSDDAQDSGATPTFNVFEPDMGGILVRGFNNFNLPNPNGLLGQVWVVTDHSDGPTAGNVYVLCSVDPPGADPMDVHLIRSTDGGATWSAPVRVNDDPALAGSHQWFGTVGVSPDGRIDVVWNDTRNFLTPNDSELFYSFSTDGGVTWSADEQLSPDWDSHVGFPNQDKIGDYYELVSDRVGAHLAWAATFNGEQDIYYLRIGDYDCNSNGVPDGDDISSGSSPDTNMNGIPDECETTTGVAIVQVPDAGGARLLGNAPNPFNPRTTISYDAPQGVQAARLGVFDAQGRAVRTLLDGSIAGGRGSVDWDGRDGRGRAMPSGTYYVRFEAAGVIDTQAIVLVQ